MSNKPDFLAFIVTASTDPTEKSQWKEVGAAWIHKDEQGADLIFRHTIPEGLKVVLRRPKEEKSK